MAAAKHPPALHLLRRSASSMRFAALIEPPAIMGIRSGTTAVSGGASL
jgi:hypothetical protein